MCGSWLNRKGQIHKSLAGRCCNPNSDMASLWNCSLTHEPEGGKLKPHTSQSLTCLCITQELLYVKSHSGNLNLRSCAVANSRWYWNCWLMARTLKNSDVLFCLSLQCPVSALFVEASVHVNRNNYQCESVFTQNVNRENWMWDFCFILAAQRQWVVYSTHTWCKLSTHL